MNFYVNNHENFETRSPVHSIVQERSTVFVASLPSFHVFSKVHAMLAIHIFQFAV
jgi:hypothetical protein